MRMPLPFLIFAMLLIAGVGAWIGQHAFHHPAPLPSAPTAAAAETPDDPAKERARALLRESANFQYPPVPVDASGDTAKESNR